MKRHNTQKWKKATELEGALFFAEVIDELLFDHSLDSFKAPALNFHVSAYEVFSLLQSASLGNVDTRKLSFAIEELSHHLATDPVVPRPIPAVWQNCVTKLKETHLEAGKLLPYASTLIMDIGDNYWSMLMDAIREAIQNPKRKDKLWALARALTAELDLAGISKQYVFQENIRYFFNPESNPKRITKIDQVLGFFVRLNRDSTKRRVFFRASENFRKYKTVLHQFKITILDEPPTLARDTDFTTEFLSERSDLSLICELGGIEAIDEYVAHQKARLLFDIVIDICKYADHREALNISQNALVTNEKLEHPYVVPSKIHPMHLRSERDSENHMNIVKGSIAVLIGDYFSAGLKSRFRKVLEYHEAALTSKVSENQLLNLWSALESLVNVKHRSGSQIEHIADVVSKIEILTYTPRVFNAIAYDLSSSWPDLESFTSDVEMGSSVLRKTTALLLCEEHDTLRSTLVKRLPGSPILRNRCYWAYEHFHTNTAMKEILENHSRRVKWHVRRIYTSRNLIVHSARSLPYLDKLIENLHNYLDTVLETIVRIGIVTKHTSDIESILTYVNVLADEYLRELNGPSKEMELATYWSKLFGHNGILMDE